MEKIKICGPRGLQRAIMKKSWKEAKEKEDRGEDVELGELMKKNRSELKKRLKAAKTCIEIEI